LRKSLFKEEQIIAILQEADAGMPIPDLCRKHGVSTATLYKWKAKFGGMQVSEARRLRLLEEENRQLKHAVAELLLNERALRAMLGKKY
jgi:putative transposase